MPPCRPRRRRCRRRDGGRTVARPRARPSTRGLTTPPTQAGGGQERGCGPAHPPPLHHLAPLPAELKYTLTRNFGFFTKIFTLPFDKVRATCPYHRSAPPTVPPRSRRPSLPSRARVVVQRRCTSRRSDPIRPAPIPSSPLSLTFEIPPRRPIHRMESRPCSSPSAWASERRARVEGGGDVTPRVTRLVFLILGSRAPATTRDARSHRTTASRLTFEHSFTFASPSPRHHLPAIIPATPTSPATSDPKLAASC